MFEDDTTDGINEAELKKVRELAEKLATKVNFWFEDVEDELRHAIDEVNKINAEEPAKDELRLAVIRKVASELQEHASRQWFEKIKEEQGHRVGVGDFLRLNGELKQCGASFIPYWAGSEYMAKGSVHFGGKRPDIDFKVYGDSIAAVAQAAQAAADEIDQRSAGKRKTDTC